MNDLLQVASASVCRWLPILHIWKPRIQSSLERPGRFNISVVMNRLTIIVWVCCFTEMLLLLLRALSMKPWDSNNCLITARILPKMIQSNYRGGTVHIVVNNQIGFTTDPRFARSTPYATDIGKAYDCPVFHVNGDDAEAITFIHQLAADWRQQFKTDVIIDIICYRKQGHNETDQPSFTQPRMYEVIKSKKPALEIYIDKLLAEGTLTKED